MTSRRAQGPRIRPATPADIASLLPLLRGLFAIEQDFVFDATKAADGLARVISAPSGLILMAEDSDRAVGMVSLQEMVSTAEGGPAGLVEDFVVAETHRGRGLGRQLADALNTEAKRRGYTRLQLLADATNAAALAFYRRLGWRETQLRALRRTF